MQRFIDLTKQKTDLEEELIKAKGELGKALKRVGYYQYTIQMIEKNHKEWSETLSVYKGMLVVKADIPKVFDMIINSDGKHIENIKKWVTDEERKEFQEEFKNV